MVKKIESFLDKMCSDEKLDVTKIISKTNLRLLTINYQQEKDKKYGLISYVMKIKQRKIYDVF